MPAYLFCAGVGAGATFVLAIMGLLVPREEVTALYTRRRDSRSFCVFKAPKAYRMLFGPPFCAAIILIAFGMLFLLGDAGTLAAPVLLFSNPTMTYLSVGSFLLVVGFLLAVFLFACWGTGGVRVSVRIVRIAHWLMALIGLAISAYTGLLLASMPAVPIWSTPWLLVLFVASSLSCGSALVMASALINGSASRFSRSFRRMESIDVAILAVEVIAVAAFLANAFSNPYEAASQGAASLTTGALSALFMFGFVGIGLAAPIVLESTLLLQRKHASQMLLAVSASVLAGGFILRYCVVTVGSHPEVWTVIS